MLSVLLRPAELSKSLQGFGFVGTRGLAPSRPGLRPV